MLVFFNTGRIGAGGYHTFGSLNGFLCFAELRAFVVVLKFETVFFMIYSSSYSSND